MKVIQRKDLLDSGYKIPATNLTTNEVEYITIDIPIPILYGNEEGIVKLVHNQVVYDVDGIDLDFIN